MVEASNSPAYDCAKCPGMCCSVYELIKVTLVDIQRLARHLRIDSLKVRTRYIQAGTYLKLKHDPVLDKTCIFFDTETRRCGVYEGRPQTCRDWPNPAHAQPGMEGRCCYFDLYRFAQKELGSDRVPIVRFEKVIEK